MAIKEQSQVLRVYVGQLRKKERNKVYVVANNTSACHTPILQNYGRGCTALCLLIH